MDGTGLLVMRFNQFKIYVFLLDPCYTTKAPPITVITYACPSTECSARGKKFSGNIADPNQPRHYIACWKGRTVACMNCPANLQFNEAKNRCE